MNESPNTSKSRLKREAIQNGESIDITPNWEQSVGVMSRTEKMGKKTALAIEREVFRDGFIVTAICDDPVFVDVWVERETPMGQAHLLSIRLHADAVPAAAIKVVRAVVFACPPN